MQVHILRPTDAAAYLGISRRTLYNLEERDPKFPRKIVFSQRCVGWRREDIDAWIRAKAAA